MFTRLRNLFLLALIPIAIAGVVRSQATQQPTVQLRGTVQDTSTIDRGDVTQTVSATGPIQAKQNVSLSFLSSGKVLVINVQQGDHVRKGQTIATLDTVSATDALTQAQAKVVAQQVALDQLTEKPRQVDINVAQASLDMAKASLASSYSGGPDKIQAQINALNVETAKNQLWQTELGRDADNNKKADLLKDPRTGNQGLSLPSDVKHNADLTNAGYNVDIAQSQLDAEKSKSADVGSIASAQAQVVSAQVALDNLMKGGNQDDVARAQAQLQAAQAALDFAKDNLARTALVAPFDGVVAQLNIHPGEMPPAGAAAVMLDTSSFYVDVPVDETDVSTVEVGQPVKLTFDALPDVTVNGKVIVVAQTPTKSGDVVTYIVRIEIDPAGQPLLSAMSTTANIITNQVSDVVRIRNRFVTLSRQGGRATVNVRQPDGTFKTVPVTLGLRNDTYSEIKSGLSAGDVVALIQAPQTFGPGGGGPGGGGGQGGGPGGGGGG